MTCSNCPSCAIQRIGSSKTATKASLRCLCVRAHPPSVDQRVCLSHLPQGTRGTPPVSEPWLCHSEPAFPRHTGPVCPEQAGTRACGHAFALSMSLSFLLGRAGPTLFQWVVVSSKQEQGCKCQAKYWHRALNQGTEALVLQTRNWCPSATTLCPQTSWWNFTKTQSGASS